MPHGRAETNWGCVAMLLLSVTLWGVIYIFCTMEWR